MFAIVYSIFPVDLRGLHSHARKSDPRIETGLIRCLHRLMNYTGTLSSRVYKTSASMALSLQLIRDKIWCSKNLVLRNSHAEPP
mmetsp:Transcript_1628/g.3069  ORF Transcript_1628/g.3069 Transcript_1628/m.3069 type:complete len:84 (+) Transcript_1628:1104-1355(+)